MISNHPQFFMSTGEMIVRRYESTVRARWFGPPLIGYLTVSNKRIIYHTHSEDQSRWDTIVAELPLDDYSGLSTSLSSTFNWFLFGLFCIVLYTVSLILADLLPPFVTGWVFAMILTIPYLVGLLFQKEIIDQDVQVQFLENLEDIPGTSIFRDRDLEYYMRVFRVLLGCGLALFAWNIAHDPGMEDQFLFMRFLTMLIIYFFIYRHLFANKLIFKLAIASKSDKKSGIMIPGNPLAQLMLGGASALSSLYAHPGQDAEVIVQELGALLTDIHQLGDLGIQRWVQSTVE